MKGPVSEAQCPNIGVQQEPRKWWPGRKDKPGPPRPVAPCLHTGSAPAEGKAHRLEGPQHVEHNSGRETRELGEELKTRHTQLHLPVTPSLTCPSPRDTRACVLAWDMWPGAWPSASAPREPRRQTLPGVGCAIRGP